MNKFKYYMLMVFATLLFAGAFIAGKLGSGSFSPVVMTFLRIGLATLIIFPIMILKEKKFKASKEELFLALKLGFVGMTCYHLFFFSALKYTTASSASVINASMPILTAIIATFMLKEKLPFKKMIFIGSAFVGVVLTIINWDINSLINMDFNKGDILMLCGTLSWSTYGVLIKKSKVEISSLKLMSYSLLICTVIISPFAIREILLYNSLNVPLGDYYSIVYMAIFPTVIGYTIQQACIKKMGPSTAALFINLVPVFSIILSVIFLNEIMNPLTYVSGLIIIVSVVLFTKVRTPN
ncbi:MAG: DMT family transporter [Clostridiales bacterium]|nr:DMT family transporter [Clostridiales bacterium]